MGQGSTNGMGQDRIGLRMMGGNRMDRDGAGWDGMGWDGQNGMGQGSTDGKG